MVDSRLMRGDGWVRCCICGERHEWPFDGLYRDADGDLVDVCSGDCAADAGLTGA